MCDDRRYIRQRGEWMPVPCGQCPTCKKRRVDGWVFRMLQQEKASLFAHFITLTYDTAHVPFSDFGHLTLRKDDLQKYFKRLRKLVPDLKLKYYAVGEYGSKTWRPHYHAIVYNVPKERYFTDAWSIDGVSLGAVHVGAVSTDSIAYTMKYIDKGSFRPISSLDDREPEFAIMSKRLGANYITPNMVKWHKADLARVYCVKDGHKIAMRKYYKDKIYYDDDRC